MFSLFPMPAHPIRLAATVALLILSPSVASADEEEKVTDPSSAQEQYELGRKYHRGEGVATDSEVMRGRIAADFSRVTDEVLAAGAGTVVWVKAPLPNPLWLSRGTEQEQPERHAVLHAVMDSIAAERPADVYVVDLLDYFDERGFTSDVDLRPDGVHITPEAAQAIAADFLGEQMIRAALDLS